MKGLTAALGLSAQPVAAQLLGATDALFAKFNTPLDVAEIQQREEAIAKSSKMLGATHFAEAYHAGQSLSVIDYRVSVLGNPTKTGISKLHENSTPVYSQQQSHTLC